MCECLRSVLLEFRLRVSIHSSIRIYRSHRPHYTSGLPRKTGWNIRIWCKDRKQFGASLDLHVRVRLRDMVSMVSVSRVRVSLVISRVCILDGDSRVRYEYR